LSVSIIAGLAGLQLLGAQFLALAGTLREIEQRGHLIVAVKDNLRPLGFRDTHGQLQGLEIDIARRLAKELFGRETDLVFRPVSNQERLAVLAKDQVDLVIAGVTVTAARSRVVSFSTPYYKSGTAVVTQAPSIQKLSDLSNQTIAVLTHSSAIAWLQYQLPKAKLVEVESYQAGQALLEAGQAIAFAGDASVLTGWVQESPKYRRLPMLLSTESFAVMMPKAVQYDQLRRRVEAAILRWQQDGWLRQRASFWGLP
jgi:polar amino acid transport system substrate-binding protein